MVFQARSACEDCSVALAASSEEVLFRSDSPMRLIYTRCWLVIVVVRHNLSSTKHRCLGGVHLAGEFFHPVNITS